MAPESCELFRSNGSIEVRSRGGAFAATKTMTIRGEDGQLDDLTAGQTFGYDEHHYLVRTYPTCGRPPHAPRNSAGVEHRGHGRSRSLRLVAGRKGSTGTPPTTTHPAAGVPLLRHRSGAKSSGGCGSRFNRGRGGAFSVRGTRQDRPLAKNPPATTGP